MGLRDYARKRRFDATPEPGPAAPRRRRTRAPIFVVQLHHARSRHYDFRLEVDGTLKSWAVPKGPSLRPGDKRLAVEVEDHPLAYAGFEGDIPAGQYGAGHVDIFDRGVWRTDEDPRKALAAGKLDFSLDGEKLRGRWTLIRTGMRGAKPQWLLMKRSDDEARDAEADDLVDAAPRAKAPRLSRGSKAAASRGRVRDVRPASSRSAPPSTRWRRAAEALPGARRRALAAGFSPELCTPKKMPPSGDEWLHETKWDGYRLLADLDGGRVRLRSRNDLDWTGKLPAIASAIEALPVASARLDGELVALDGEGRSDFSALQEALKTGATKSLRYALFDLPALEGVDLTAVPLIERKSLLERLVGARKRTPLFYSSHVLGHGARVFDEATRRGLEGIVSKDAHSHYAQRRSSRWIKAKHANTDEFVVVGWTAPKGSRQGFGALLLAAGERGKLRYVGRVGTGFDERMLADLAPRLRSIACAEPVVDLPAHLPFGARSVHWVDPKLVAEVEFRGWAKEGLLRQASFFRWREDKSVSGSETRARRSAPRRAARGSAADDVAITHPDRVVYPEEGLTKGDVADYYRAVAAHMLPEVVGRPLSIVRCPDGVSGQCFFQKHHAQALGAHVESVEIREKSGSQARYLYIENETGLLELVQMNVLEFHVWGARIDDADRPDRLVFDLDPAPDVAWPALVEAARDVRAHLRRAGLESFVRLSGGKGMHVVAPIARGPGWDEAKAFCEAVANTMTSEKPDTYIATASKAQRKGLVFIDWLRNARGATSVASWSLRARDGATVAMPLRWNELGRTKGPAAYDLVAAKKRAASLRGDPWPDFADLDQTLPDVPGS